MLLFSPSSTAFLGSSSLHLLPKINTNRPPSSTPSCVRFRQPKLVAAYTTSVCTDMASSASLYEVLGIPMSATGNEIKAAYRKLARTCHPDVAVVNRRETSANEFMKIHAAYSTLSDPDKRAAYDRDLSRLRHVFGSSSATSGAMAAAASMSSRSEFSGYYPRRNWESDQCW